MRTLLRIEALFVAMTEVKLGQLNQLTVPLLQVVDDSQ